MKDIEVKIKVNAKDGSIEVEDLNGKIRKIGDTGEKASRMLQGAFGRAAKAVGEIGLGVNQGLMAIQKLISFTSKPLQSAMKFENMITKLEVVLGSTEKAKERLAELSTFASKTPFSLGGLTEASNQLQTLGKYSKETIGMLTNLAAGSGKSIEQVTEAYIKMARGKKGIAVELFRDIGISIEDFVKATGKGIDKQTGQITASSQEMLKALDSIVKDRGFAELVDKQANTLQGQLKRMEMAFNSMIGAIGKLMLPIAKNILDTLLPVCNWIKSNFTSVLKVTAGVVGVVASATLANYFKVPVENIKGHCEVDKKKPLCPSLDMEKERKIISELMINMPDVARDFYRIRYIENGM